VYFGYPQAHEDDAERAVRTGLALIEAVGKVRAQEPLQVRIGVNERPKRPWLPGGPILFRSPRVAEVHRAARLRLLGMS
jgi:hypothetical protein